MHTLTHALHHGDEGASAVEFALVGMALALLLTGIIQFGWLFMEWLELTHAAREGARWAALRHEAGSVSTPDTTRYRCWDAAPGLSPRLTDADIVITPPDPGTGDIGDPVTVTVSHDVPMFTLFMSNLFGGTGTYRLSSTATMRVE